jgi:hypothetical protein
MSFKLSVEIKSNMVSVILLNVVMLSAIVLSVVASFLVIYTLEK